MRALPRATGVLVAFGRLLRMNGFAVSPGQSMTFVEAVGLLGPRGIEDIHRAARATLAPPHERDQEFEALFRHHFLGQSLAVPDLQPSEEEETEIRDERAGESEPPEIEGMEESGEAATSAESLLERQFPRRDPLALLRRFERDLPGRLPKRRAYRRKPKKTGDLWHFRRALRDAARHDGELVTLPRLGRIERQKRLLLLIDVSGSMKTGTDDLLRLAHALARAAERSEIFTIGTRLTRITRALRRRSATQALDAVSSLVADFDGGTRLGEAMDAFLAIPRFASFARGAVVVILSDGLERGDHTLLLGGMARLRRLADSITWLTPLSSGEVFEPQTTALRAIRPYLDHLGSAASLDHATNELLRLGENRQ